MQLLSLSIVSNFKFFIDISQSSCSIPFTLRSSRSSHLNTSTIPLYVESRPIRLIKQASSSVFTEHFSNYRNAFQEGSSKDNLSTSLAVIVEIEFSFPDSYSVSVLLEFVKFEIFPNFSCRHHIISLCPMGSARYNLEEADFSSFTFFSLNSSNAAGIIGIF